MSNLLRQNSPQTAACPAKISDRLPATTAVTVYSAADAERYFHSWWVPTCPSARLNRLAQASRGTAGGQLIIVYAPDGSLFGVGPAGGILYGFTLAPLAPKEGNAPFRSPAYRAAVAAGMALTTPDGTADFRARVFALAARLAAADSEAAVRRELTTFRPTPPGPEVEEIRVAPGATGVGTAQPGTTTIIGRLLATYRDPSCDFIQAPGRVRPPQPEGVRRVIGGLLPLLFPGYRGPLPSDPGFNSFVCRRVSALQSRLTRLVRQALAFRDAVGGPPAAAYRAVADLAVVTFFEALPYIRRTLSADAAAAYRNDPALAAGDQHTTPLAYPGLYATAVHRIAHQLHIQEVPYLPRMMSELAHSQTGIDIHPGARIGRGFFIDHGTGVVVGETAVIGEDVTLYQGVTIGALNFEWDEVGNLLRGAKRHPTLHSRTTVYAGASVLGDIDVGHSTKVGANVSLRQSVPPESVIRIPFSLRELSIYSPQVALERTAAGSYDPTDAGLMGMDPEIVTGVTGLHDHSRLEDDAPREYRPTTS